MNSLPTDLFNIINDYKYQLEISDKKKKLHLDLLNTMSKRKIIYESFIYYDRCVDGDNNWNFIGEDIGHNRPSHYQLDDSCDCLFVYSKENSEPHFTLHHKNYPFYQFGQFLYRYTTHRYVNSYS